MTTSYPAARPHPMLEHPAPEIGWRDQPVEDDACVRCDGWGTVTRWKRIARPETKDGHVLEHEALETCPRCLGTGRRRR